MNTAYSSSGEWLQEESDADEQLWVCKYGESMPGSVWCDFRHHIKHAGDILSCVIVVVSIILHFFCLFFFSRAKLLKLQLVTSLHAVIN